MTESATLTVRAREASDLAAVVGWVPDSGALHLFAATSLAWPLTQQQLADVGEVPGRTSWMLVDVADPSAPLAHADLTVKGDRARIGRVIVDPACRGRGLGATLVGLVVEEARHVGCTQVDLVVIEGNARAFRTYEGLGFRYEPASDIDGMIGMMLELDL
ncbi:GNAT family N-acetyltransferase [Diaminobutyricibacter sp. McL0618]|uniref:GNAT family N-acetyltransferase n=1 Tax=Leifsonia sp. McL0618 TaxID=3415677 RepID=UPI003CFABB2F